MRGLFIATVAAVSAIAFTQIGSAADLPRKAPPLPAAPIYNWTGFYVGLNAGGTFGGSNSFTSTAYPIIPAPGNTAQTNFSFAAAATATGIAGGGNNSRFIGGGQFGYNWQFNDSFVAGIEADIQGIAGASRTQNTVSALAIAFPPPGGSIFSTTGQFSSRLDYLGTVRGRLGWLSTPSLLLYGTGGLAYGGVNASGGFLTLATIVSPGGANQRSSTAASRPPTSELAGRLAAA